MLKVPFSPKNLRRELLKFYKSAISGAPFNLPKLCFGQTVDFLIWKFDVKFHIALNQTLISPFHGHIDRNKWSLNDLMISKRRIFHDNKVCRLKNPEFSKNLFLLFLFTISHISSHIITLKSVYYCLVYFSCKLFAYHDISISI